MAAYPVATTSEQMFDLGGLRGVGEGLPMDGCSDSWSSHHMRTRPRILTFALAITAIAIAAGCTSPPSGRALTSPYYSWSTDTSATRGQLNTCSVAGGPVAVTIVDSKGSPPPLSIEVSINVGGQLFDASQPLTAVGDSWTSKPLSPGTCFDVTLEGDGLGFRFRIDW